MQEITKKFAASLVFSKCRKKPVVVECCQMDENFRVETLSGPVELKAGDYLMRGVEGELYPCVKEIFEKTYDFV